MLILIIYNALPFFIVPRNTMPQPHAPPCSWCFAHVSITTPIAPALKKLLYLEISRSPGACSKQLLDPGGRFAAVSEAQRQLCSRFRSETVKNYNGYVQRKIPNGHKRPFVCNGYHATAKANGFFFILV